VRRRAALALGLALWASRAWAGDPGPLPLIFVNLTPEADSTPAARACVADLRARLGEAYTELRTLGETALREKVGMTAGEPFLSWPDEALDRIRKHPDARDGARALVLVDCRPQARRLDVRVLPKAGGSFRIQSRRVALKRRTLDWVFTGVLHHLHDGHDP
jgi:hypothetical protein